MTHPYRKPLKRKYRRVLAMRLDLLTQQWATLKVFPRRELWEVRLEVTGYAAGDPDEVRDEVTYRNRHPVTAAEMVPSALQYIERLTGGGDEELGPAIERVTGGAVELHKLTLMSKGR